MAGTAMPIPTTTVPTIRTPDVAAAPVSGLLCSGTRFGGIARAELVDAHMHRCGSGAALPAMSYEANRDADVARGLVSGMTADQGSGRERQLVARGPLPCGAATF